LQRRNRLYLAAKEAGNEKRQTHQKNWVPLDYAIALILSQTAGCKF